jgi:hypothetical protein
MKMKTVNFKHIEGAINKIDSMDDDALDQLNDVQAAAQPTLISYVMSAVDEYKNEKLESLLVFYFTVLHEAFVLAGNTPREVTETDIDEFEEPYFEVLDAYFNTEDEALLEEFTDQPELVKFMAMEIGNDEGDDMLDDETATQVFIVSMALTSLLSRASV